MPTFSEYEDYMLQQMECYYHDCEMLKQEGYEDAINDKPNKRLIDKHYCRGYEQGIIEKTLLANQS